jgi:hypothetical protein
VLLGGAIYFSTLPLSVSFNSHGFQGLFLDEWPERVPALVAALALWVTYWRKSRRLRLPRA